MLVAYKSQYEWDIEFKTFNAVTELTVSKHSDYIDNIVYFRLSCSVLHIFAFYR